MNAHQKLAATARAADAAWAALCATVNAGSDWELALNAYHAAKREYRAAVKALGNKRIEF